MAKSEQKTWHDHFSNLLKRSSVSPTSAAIAAAIRDRLPKERSRGVSTGLVTKWRSKGSKRKLFPSDIVVARALMSALDDLGVFRGSQTAKEDRRDLLELLGYDSTRTAEEIFRDMSGEAQLSLLHLLQERGMEIHQLIDSEIQLAAVCLLSQQVFEQGAIDLVADKGRVITYFVWDSGRSAEASFARNRLVEEIKSGGFKEYVLGELIAKGVAVDVIFAVYDRDNQRADRCKLEIETLADEILNDRACPVDEHDETASIRVWEMSLSGSPATTDHFWIHLHKDDKSQAWRIVRHHSLFKKIEYSRVSTFASPLEHDDIRRFLTRLNIEWSQLDAEWIIQPGDRVYGKREADYVRS